MAFVGRTKKAQQQFESPEAMYLSGTLPRTTEAVDGLWLHQGDVIRAYAEHYQKSPDLALELPTGSGKTIPGLLIGEWIRRKNQGPVIYATPTKQLARQVFATAQREGVPSHLLIGSARSWNVAEQSAVEGGEAIGLVTYSAIFNSSPKLPDPRLILASLKGSLRRSHRFPGRTPHYAFRYATEVCVHRPTVLLKIAVGNQSAETPASPVYSGYSAWITNWTPENHRPSGLTP